MPEKHIGKVVQVMGARTCTGHPIQDGELPALLNAVELENNAKPIVEGCPAHWRRHVVLHCHGGHRRPCPRYGCRGYRANRSKCRHW